MRFFHPESIRSGSIIFGRFQNPSIPLAEQYLNYGHETTSTLFARFMAD
jgi:hypothetical protein